jgi:Bacteriophage HK97-gp10, putative tail-component
MARRVGRVTLDMTDFEAAVRHLGSIEPLLDREGRRAATEVAAATRAVVPVRSGQLRASIGVTGNKVNFGGGVPYASWIEFGGYGGRQRRSHRPFVKGGRYFWPAVKQVSRRYRKAVRTGTEQIVRTA